MRRWRIIEEENIADLVVEVFGESKEKLLENILFAFTSLTTEINKVKPTDQLKNLEIKGANFEELIFNFVEKLIFLKDAKLLLFKKGKFKIEDQKIKADLFGQKIVSGLPLKIDIKALTKHKFGVVKDSSYYKVFMVFDI